MAVLVIAELPGVTAEQDDATVKMMDLEGDPPVGNRMRMSGPTDSGWRVMSLWESREAFDAFVRDRLAPGLKRLDRTVPEFQYLPVERVLTFR